MNIIKRDGKLFLSFPTTKSINFPHRKGTLNYFDDATHQYNPPDFDEIIQKLKENNFEIIFQSASYKPIIHYLAGLILEPLSKLTKRILFSGYATWSYWGFESIIWAKKK
jgi:hypothetical protein